MKVLSHSWRTILSSGFIYTVLMTGDVTAQEHNVFLIGDAGEMGTIQDAALSSLSSLLASKQDSGKNSTVVFLGDNIYPCGLNSRGDMDCQYAAIKKLNSRLPTDTGMLILKKQIDIAQHGYQGYVVFVSGNHDWSAGDADGKVNVINEEDSVEYYLAKNKTIANNNNFMPSEGRPGPESIIIDNEAKLKLIALDSQWWLHYLPDPPGADEMHKTVQILRAEIDSALREGFRILIVAHHPIYTIGNHARHSFFGKFLKKVKVQDVTAKSYRKYRKEILSLIDSNPNIVYASGHDHNLQFFHDDQKAFYVISGAGSKCDTLNNQPGRFRELLRRQAIRDFHPPDILFPLTENYSSWGFSKLTYDSRGLKEIWFYYDQFPQGKLVYIRKT